MRVENLPDGDWRLTLSTRELRRIEDALHVKASSEGGYFRDQAEMRDALRMARLTTHEIQVLKVYGPSQHQRSR